MVNECEIYDEFESLCSMDLETQQSFAHVVQHLGGIDGFYQGKKWRDYQIAFHCRIDKLLPFAEKLKELKIVKYAAIETGIAYSTAVKYSDILIDQASKLGLPAYENVIRYEPYVSRAKERILKGTHRRPNVKLNEAKVRGIRMLLSAGYSTYKVAILYEISQSTIHQISTWATWKNVAVSGIERPLSLLEQAEAWSKDELNKTAML